MPSAFDLLGTIFGVLSLLGCFKTAYSFLKNRQPLAQAELLEETLREVRQRVDELERYGYLSESPALSAIYKSALAKIDRESLRVRAQAERHRPSSAVAVFVYSWRQGVNCTLSRHISAFTKLVQGIEKQLDYPVDNPYIDYSLVQGQRQPRQELEQTLITDARNQADTHRSTSAFQSPQNTERMNRCKLTRASDPPVDADMASLIYAIRESRMQQMQGELEIIAQSIIRKSEIVYDLPSNVVKLNRQLVLGREAVPFEDSSVGVEAHRSAAAEETGNSVGLLYRISNTLRRTKSSQNHSTRAIAEQEAQHDVIEDTDEEVGQREAAIRDMIALRDWFDDVSSCQFFDGKLRNSSIMFRLRERARQRLAVSPSPRTDAPEVGASSGFSATQPTGHR